MLLSSNISVKQAAILLHIQKFQCLYLSPESGYPEKFCDFPQLLQADSETVV
ncbi:hypothetical protein B7P43_G09529 [Cryptotermes secundus]|uniref:Uncharacterized protein n=1 Tax=Cryptotermes secundus TaxID=105785 RepID=A0A2J7QMK7_9NEOP|nr:hypothetical protein B7P43_G09529 [Cryptotermes secundus]